MKLIILDAGHAEKVAGKCSPDLSFKEWKFNNEMQYMLKERLEDHNFNVYLTNPYPANEDEMGLTTRANKANNYWKSLGCPDALFYSIHANAFLNTNSKGQYIMEFTSPRGPVTFKAKNASSKTDNAAKILQSAIVDAMKKIDSTTNLERGVMIQNFTVIYKTKMPSILMEYAFYTNKKDLAILNNNKKDLVEATVKGFCKYFDVEYIPPKEKKSVEKIEDKKAYNREVKVVGCTSLNVRENRPNVLGQLAPIKFVLKKGDIARLGYVYDGWGSVYIGNNWGFVNVKYLEFV